MSYTRPSSTAANISFTAVHYEWISSSNNEISLQYLETQGYTLNGSTLNGPSCLNGPNFYSESTVSDNVVFYQTVGIGSTVSNDIIFRQVVNFRSTSTVGNDIIFRQNVVCTGPNDAQITCRQRVYG